MGLSPELPPSTPTDLPWGIWVNLAAAAAFARCPGLRCPDYDSSRLYPGSLDIVADLAVSSEPRPGGVRGDAES